MPIAVILTTLGTVFAAYCVEMDFAWSQHHMRWIEVLALASPIAIFLGWLLQFAPRLHRLGFWSSCFGVIIEIPVLVYGTRGGAWRVTVPLALVLLALSYMLLDHRLSLDWEEP
jgi:hypothetical protein